MNTFFIITLYGRDTWYRPRVHRFKACCLAIRRYPYITGGPAGSCTQVQEQCQSRCSMLVILTTPKNRNDTILDLFPESFRVPVIRYLTLSYNDISPRIGFGGSMSRN